MVWVLIAGGITCAAMAWAIGANDVGNIFGTSVGSGVLSLKSAVILGGVFEFLGAVTMGDRVSSTFLTIIQPQHYKTDWYMFQLAMLR
jgi:inorganic phosphate transporter, PiT family